MNLAILPYSNADARASLLIYKLLYFREVNRPGFRGGWLV